MRLLPALLVLVTAKFTGSAIWARCTLASFSSSFTVAFLATSLRAPLLLLLFAGGALRFAGRRVRPILLLLYLIGASVTSELVVEFVRLVQFLE
jgi:hypothetical protein